MQLSNNLYETSQLPSQWRRFWQEFNKNVPAVFALWFFILLILVTLFAPWLTPFDVEFQTGEVLMPPSWDEFGRVEYFLGTDALSRDMLTRLIAGSQFSFGYALLIAFSAGLIGVAIGIMTGLYQGMLSSLLMAFLDAILAIPSLLVAIIFVSFYGDDGLHVLLALWLAMIPRFIRTTHTAVTDEMGKEYILSARLDGANRLYLLYHAIMPNILVNITNTFTKSISITILDIAGIGFLSLTGPSLTPEWGQILSESVEYVFIAPWTVVLPCFAITFSVLIVYLLGDGVAEAINAGTT